MDFSNVQFVLQKFWNSISLDGTCAATGEAQISIFSNVSHRKRSLD